MTNKDITPVFPFDNARGCAPGMTLRQHYAGLAMQGILASGFNGPMDHLVHWAVKNADALIDEEAK